MTLCMSKRNASVIDCCFPKLSILPVDNKVLVLFLMFLLIKTNLKEIIIIMMPIIMTTDTRTPAATAPSDIDTVVRGVLVDERSLQSTSKYLQSLVSILCRGQFKRLLSVPLHSGSIYLLFFPSTALSVVIFAVVKQEKRSVKL